MNLQAVLDVFSDTVSNIYELHGTPIPTDLLIGKDAATEFILLCNVGRFKAGDKVYLLGKVNVRGYNSTTDYDITAIPASSISAVYLTQSKQPLCNFATDQYDKTIQTQCVYQPLHKYLGLPKDKLCLRLV